jgi:hypothetical protein
MTLKQLPGLNAPDKSWYGTLTDGAGNLVTTSLTTAGTKQLTGGRSPDGSHYLCITDGNGNLGTVTAGNPGAFVPLFF